MNYLRFYLTLLVRRDELRFKDVHTFSATRKLMVAGLIGSSSIYLFHGKAKSN